MCIDNILIVREDMELKDPAKNRKVNTIPLPYQRSLSQEQLFAGAGVDFKLLQKFLKREGKLSKKLFLELVRRAKELLSNTVSIQKMSPTS